MQRRLVRVPRALAPALPLYRPVSRRSDAIRASLRPLCIGPAPLPPGQPAFVAAQRPTQEVQGQPPARRRRAVPGRAVTNEAETSAARGPRPSERWMLM